VTIPLRLVGDADAVALGKVEQARSELARFLTGDALQALDCYLAAIMEAGSSAAPAKKRWLTVEEAADELGCTPATLRKRLERGRLAKHRQGGRVYVDRLELDASLSKSV
jgi:excisionase family DNA binding protein